MRSIIIFTLSFSSLILATACRQKPSQAQQEPSIQSLDETGLQEQILRSSRPYVLVNMYNTRCKPCVKEIPDLLSFNQEASGEVEVLMLAIDDLPSFKDKLPSFMEKCGASFSTFHMSSETARSFVGKIFPDWDGMVPLNALYTSDGRLVEVTGLTDHREVTMIIHNDQSFHP